MARYPLNLPQRLKQEAEIWAKQQGVSLNQFILWAIAEKVGSLSQGLDDPQFPQITYRRGASGNVTAVLRGTGIRVQTIVTMREVWGRSPAEIAVEYALSERQIREALDFYAEHCAEIDQAIAMEEEIEAESHG